MPSIFLIQYSVSLGCTSQYGSKNGRKLPVHADFKFIFFMISTVVATLLVRSHVLFKFLNYVTDKIVIVVLTTLALMLRCVQTICVSVRERPRAGESRLCAFCT